MAHHRALVVSNCYCLADKMAVLLMLGKCYHDTVDFGIPRVCSFRTVSISSRSSAVISFLLFLECLSQWLGGVGVCVCEGAYEGLRGPMRAYGGRGCCLRFDIYM